MDQTTASTQPKSSHGARNFFFYFLMFFLLYIVAVGLGGVLFNIINKSFPTVGSYYDGGVGALRFSLSSLIIGSPLFLWLSRKVYRLEKTDQVMLRSGIRRWLTYITLIVAALIVIGDLISLVNYLLGGETTVRFILKSLVVLGIAGSIFYYYLTDVKETKQADSGKPSPLPKIYFQGAVAVVLIVIVSGFFFIESPKIQRQRNQDNERISNLQEIDYTIGQYVMVNSGALPKSLDELTLREGLTNDPLTKEPYDYEIVNPTKYRLCATFETSNKEKDASGEYFGPYGPNWLHDAGRACFDQSIDQIIKDGGYPVKPLPVSR